MSKGMRNTIIVIVIVLLIFAILVAVYQHFQSEPMDANITGENILDDANTGLENMLNEIFDEENTNSEQNIVEGNNEVTNTSTNTSSSTQTNTEVEPTEDDNRMTPRETKAIELVKEQWTKDYGSIKDVSFNVSIQSDGKYGVTVYDTTTTRSIQFYIVDVDTEIVKER